MKRHWRWRIQSKKMSIQLVDPELVAHAESIVKMIRFPILSNGHFMSDQQKATMALEAFGFISSMATIQETLQNRYIIALPIGY